MDQEAQLAKIVFELDRDDDGWPPAVSEGLWAIQLGRDLFRLDNTPWFVRGVAADDVVRAEQDASRVWRFAERSESGGRLTIRVAPSGIGSGEEGRQAVLDAFKELGVSGEGISSPISLVALDIPPGAPYARLKALLQAGEADGRWFYEDGCVSAEWRLIGD